MTISQAVYTYGKRKYKSTVGDSLIKIARKLYGEPTSTQLTVLTSLNRRCDWSNVKPSETIFFLTKEVCSKINEV